MAIGFEQDRPPLSLRDTSPTRGEIVLFPYELPIRGARGRKVLPSRTGLAAWPGSQRRSPIAPLVGEMSARLTEGGDAAYSQPAVTQQKNTGATA